MNEYSSWSIPSVSFLIDVLSFCQELYRMSSYKHPHQKWMYYTYHNQMRERDLNTGCVC